MFDAQKQTVLKFHAMIRYVNAMLDIQSLAIQYSSENPDDCPEIIRKLADLKLEPELESVSHADVANVLAFLPSEAEMREWRSESEKAITSLKAELEARAELIKHMEYMISFYMNRKQSLESAIESNSPGKGIIEALRLGLPFGA